MNDGLTDGLKIPAVVGAPSRNAAREFANRAGDRHFGK